MSWPDLEREHELIARGYTDVIGVDEVGRGALAGPVVVCATLWRVECGDLPEGLRDSKLIRESVRATISHRAASWVLASALGRSEPERIDREGIMPALSNAGVLAVSHLLKTVSGLQRPVILLDGIHDWLSAGLSWELPVVTRAKADRDCGSVAAASVIAKVARDEEMVDWDARHPGYGFARHKGYGSAEHRDAISRLGVCAIHRRSWIHPDQSDPGQD